MEMVMIHLLVVASALGLATLQTPPATDAPEPLEAGKTLYREARFGEAIDTLVLAIRSLEKSGDVAARTRRLADAYLHLGLAYYALGEREIARDAFKNVLRIDPEQRLDPEIYAPKVVELFERARTLIPHLEPETAGQDAGATARRQEIRPFGPRLAFEVTGGLDRLPQGTAPSSVSLTRLAAVGSTLSAVSVEPASGGSFGAAISIRLHDRRSRIGLSLEPLASEPSASYLGALSDQLSLDHNWKVRNAEIRLTWSRQAYANDVWTLATEFGYGAAYLGIENVDTLRYAMPQSTPESTASFAARNSSDTIDTWMHRLRAALLVNRALGRRVTIEGALGYSLALRQQTAGSPLMANASVSDPLAAQVPATEFGGLFDVRFGVRLALSRWVSLGAFYRRENYGSTVLGDIRTSRYQMALRIQSGD
jgi:tetratricopeptide (TPR) repeat protein